MKEQDPRRTLIASRNKHGRSFPRRGLTEHPGGRGVWLNLLRGDFLNDVPQLPRHLGLEDVKRLVRMQPTIALVVVKEFVVGVLVPLQKKGMIRVKERSVPGPRLPPGSHPPLGTRGGREGARRTLRHGPFLGADSRLLSTSQLSLERGGVSMLLVLRGTSELGDLGTASGSKIIGSGNGISADRGPWHHLIPLSFLKR